MKQVGVQRIIRPSACGSLKPELEPGTFVVCDQFVDRTRLREDTFYDGPQTTHVSAADPYCPDSRRPGGRRLGRLALGGTVVVIQGPRFSTRAESRWFTSAGSTCQHDPVSGGVARPGARALLCEPDAGHRLRRRPGGCRVVRSPPKPRSRCSAATSIDCARSCSGRYRGSGPSLIACAPPRSSAIVH